MKHEASVMLCCCYRFVLRPKQNGKVVKIDKSRINMHMLHTGAAQPSWNQPCKCRWFGLHSLRPFLKSWNNPSPRKMHSNLTRGWSKRLEVANGSGGPSYYITGTVQKGINDITFITELTECRDVICIFILFSTELGWQCGFIQQPTKQQTT